MCLPTPPKGSKVKGCLSYLQEHFLSLQFGFVSTMHFRKGDSKVPNSAFSEIPGISPSSYVAVTCCWCLRQDQQNVLLVTSCCFVLTLNCITTTMSSEWMLNSLGLFLASGPNNYWTNLNYTNSYYSSRSYCKDLHIQTKCSKYRG